MYVEGSVIFGVLVSLCAVVSALAVMLVVSTFAGVVATVDISVSWFGHVSFAGVFVVGQVSSGGVHVTASVEPVPSGGFSVDTESASVDSEYASVASGGISVTPDAIPVASDSCVASESIPSLEVSVAPCSTGATVVVPSVGSTVAPVESGTVSAAISGSIGVPLAISGNETGGTFVAGGKGTARLLSMCCIRMPSEGPPAAMWLPCSSGITAASAFLGKPEATRTVRATTMHPREPMLGICLAGPGDSGPTQWRSSVPRQSRYSAARTNKNRPAALTSNAFVATDGGTGRLLQGLRARRARVVVELRSVHTFLHPPPSVEA